MASKKDPCPNGYRRNRNGRCVPKRSGELGLATSMFGIIGSFIGANRQKQKEEKFRQDMLKEGIRPGEPIKSKKATKPKMIKGGSLRRKL
tara:strand:+ start:1873 stop:2142 length:270 start_codon:yes stop_codon:yes gene_type:complete